MNPRKKSKQSADAAERAREYFRAKKNGKRNYAKADRLAQELASQLGAGAEIPLDSTGRKAVIVDRFLEKDGTPKEIVWTPCGARRWEIEEKP